jgi:acetyl-CoA hydrolase
MDWLSQYEPKKVTPQEALRVLKDGYRIFITGNCSVPQTIMEALKQRARELRDLNLIPVLTVGKADIVRPELTPHLRVNSLFISGNVRDAVNDGRADFTPVFLGPEIPPVHNGASADRCGADPGLAARQARLLLVWR